MAGRWLTLNTKSVDLNVKNNKIKHQLKRRVAIVFFNNLQLLFLGRKSCPYYMRTGSCKFAVACKFHHPQQAASFGAYPMAGSPPSTTVT